ncbi:hypothetical protein [Lentzea aerocolonigenes]|uniref:hypothetical protein n=1 Tax=Lentzea aerocolonigenes TaxID=68170 RepID=UPI0004C431AD|nr:hypothetical protein [Lentzea aerocolonigenes]MCP2248757.1 hypothetical protein [Lentzea aerocolonigenes]
MSTRTDENRLRRVATRTGLRLVKSRRRNPEAIGFGGYMLLDIRTNVRVFGLIDSPEALDLNEVGEYLAKEAEPPVAEPEHRVQAFKVVREPVRSPEPRVRTFTVVREPLPPTVPRAIVIEGDLVRALEVNRAAVERQTLERRGDSR